MFVRVMKCATMFCRKKYKKPKPQLHVTTDIRKVSECPGECVLESKNNQIRLK